MPMKPARRLARIYGRHFYQVRRTSGVKNQGFLAFVPPDFDQDALYNAVIATPMRWRLLAIAYYRRPDGSLYRGWCETTTDQAFTAQGQALVPLLESTLDGAKHAAEDEGTLYDCAVVLRAFMKGCPCMKPVLRLHRDCLDLREQEIRCF